MGENNINKLSFFQKVELAKQNLKAQGKTAPTTADIVNEMVNITKAEKGEGLPDGFKIEHLAQTRGADDSGTSANVEVYNTPNIPQFQTSFAQMLAIIQKLSADTTISQEGKKEIVDILLSMVELMKQGGDVPPELVDIIKSLEDEIIVIDEPVVLYGTPDIPDVIENPKVKTVVDYINKFMTNNAIPDDIKSKLMDIMNNLDSYDNPRSSVTELLLLVTNKLITDNNLPQNIVNEFINILNELGLDGTITSENGILICVTDKPDITNNPKYEPLFNLIEELMKNDNIPDEIKGKLQSLLLHPDNIKDPAKSVQAIIADAVNKLIEENNVPEDVLNEIINLVNNVGLDTEVQVEQDAVICVYDSPNANPRVKGLLSFVNKIMSSEKLSDEVKAKIQEIMSELSDLISPDTTLAEIFITIINKLFSEMNLDDDTKQTIVGILSDIDIDDDLSELTVTSGGYCVYDTPNIRNNRFKLVLDILDKIKAQDSQIPEDYKYELVLLLKEIIIELIGQNNIPPEIMEKLDEFLGINTGFNNVALGKKLEGTQKMLVRSEEEFYAKYPADKYEIVHKMSMGHNMLMIFFKEK